jgi:hypothetical protein
MTNDADWVEDVKRWYHASVRSATASDGSADRESTDLMALGYEAAQPALEARHWPDAPVTAVDEPR